MDEDDFLFDMFDSDDQLLQSLEQQIYEIPIEEKLTHQNDYIRQLGLKEIQNEQNSSNSN